MSRHELTIEVEADDSRLENFGLPSPDDWTAAELAEAYSLRCAVITITNYRSLDVSAADIVADAKRRAGANLDTFTRAHHAIRAGDEGELRQILEPGAEELAHDMETDQQRRAGSER